ncbi:MAG: carboxypeptidase-like regulatory domain-containing protein [Acidobacteriia bacterium]|nr:carboxypeptidase-like regulatory domain-containing protein [Terriglobia bacterium]
MLQRFSIGCLALISLLVTGCEPRIHGVVTSKDGKPVAQALIYVSAVHGHELSMAATELTDSSGAYSANPGHNRTDIYRIVVTSDNFEPANRVVNTAAGATVDFVLEPAVIYKGSYKAGDEVQARDIEWCPARITDLGTGEYEGRYEIEFLTGNGARLMLPPRNIRPKGAGFIDPGFACPFRVKKKE